MSHNARSDPGARRNRRVAIVCAVGFFGMVGTAYAAVPLYRAFCQLTGFDGTVRRADAAPGKVLDKAINVRFDANVRDLPWTFAPVQRSQAARLGETKLAFYKVTNTSDRPITGRAVFNVTPELAGRYFRKLDCFCFTDQTVAPGATVEMPVLYFIDPEYAEDFDTRGKPEVTLSYTFFAAEPAQAAAKTTPAG